ncbi:MAG TPA: DUF3352 domain-containing protein [Salinimicrobium sp.]|nr:DUF3352 domain-containing protein [Salinimicrobium sp.]
MKKILLLLLVVFIFGCSEEKASDVELSNYIPENAAVILKLHNPDLFFSNLQNNNFLKENSSHPFSEELKSKLSFLNYFPHKKEGILVFSTSKNGKIDFLFLSRGIPEIKLDSIKNKSVETSTFEDFEIKKYTLEDKITYSTAIDSVFMISDSKNMIFEQLKRKNDSKLAHFPDFEKALKAASDKNPSIFINHEKITPLFKKLFPKAHFSLLKNFSNWTVLDVEIDQASVALNGVTTATDTIPKFINIFRGTNPGANEIAGISPMNSTSIFSFTFDDFTVLHKNLQDFRKEKSKNPASAENVLLSTATEAGMIYLPSAEVFIVKSNDIEAAQLAFSSGQELVEEYRGIPIFGYSGGKKFKNLLQPLLSPENLKYYAILERFLLFSENREAIKEIISNFQNKTTLAESEAFQKTFENLSSEASLLLVSNNRNFKKTFSEKVPEEYQKSIAELSFLDYPFAALQFIYNNNFAHVHAILQKTGEVPESSGIVQEFAINLEEDLAAPPVFFENHRSNGLDVAVQDNSNTLYLISDEGKIFWKKKLDSRIIGEIQQVDLLKNGRIQLAFTTQNAFHVIDREGNTVKPFPLTFKDPITQALAVFDYDNKRDYRFMVVQGENVYMYNNKGRRVKGFQFENAGNEIVKTPKHIRIGKKDYILIAEASGKLNILSRTGSSRVSVKEDINFSENEWYEYENRFVSTNEQGELVKIDQKGNISRENLGLTEEHNMVATAKTLVTLSENELSIKGNKVTLDFGLYTEPQIFYINNKIYVAITDTQAHRVFLFDSNGELLPNFPVYGNSKIDLGNVDNDDHLEFVVQGEKNSILLYEL